MPAHWRQIAEEAQALAENAAVAANIRSLAVATQDLLGLVATWPVPRRLGFEEDLAAALFSLCEHSGRALCNERLCARPAGRAASASCHLILPMLGRQYQAPA